MKIPIAFPTLLSVGVLAAGVGLAQQKGKGKPRPPEMKWRVQQLHKDNNEGAAVGDINGDGKLDVVAGEFWYAAPDYDKKHKVRRLSAFGADYLNNNSDHLYDVDGDGDLDVLTEGFTLPEIQWFENPGAGNYEAPDGWKQHTLIDTGTKNNEISFVRDIDGDGAPEFFENSWKDENPMDVFRLAKDGAGAPIMEKHVIAASGNGHGMGFGDINGDGLEDIIFKHGWYERPADGPFSGPWKYHPDFTFDHASCPMIVVDLNGDGRNDIIWANGHSYGLVWEEQQEPQSDGSTTWRTHAIDLKSAQCHAMAWEDIDNDGESELITGKRYYAHSGKDPGAEDDVTIQYYDWIPEENRWVKHWISKGPAGQAPGTGLQIRVADLDENGWKDVIVPGKSGTHIIWNNGFPAKK